MFSIVSRHARSIGTRVYSIPNYLSAEKIPLTYNTCFMLLQSHSLYFTKKIVYILIKSVYDFRCSRGP